MSLITKTDKMEKWIKTTQVDFDLDWTDGVKIEKLKEDIATLEELGVTDVDISLEDNYGDCCIVIRAYIEQIETDEEFNARIEREKEEEKQQYDDVTRRELAELKRLKEKYGS
jgi:6-phosphofructokinase